MNVLDVIKSRKAMLDHSGAYSDSFRLGLSVEGGGMRGIVTAAMLVALKEQGLIDVFDSFYGSSSGCANLAYVLAGQNWEGISIYYDKLATKAFISPSRALRGKNIMNMEYVRHVWKSEVPLNVDALLGSNRDIVLTLANVSKGIGILRRDFKDTKDFLEALIASVQIPILGGKPVKIRGDNYLDGGLFYADPFYAAIEDGCSHVLALHCRPRDGYPAKLTSGTSLVAQLINNMGDGAGDIYIERLTKYYRESNELGFGAVRYGGVELYRHAVPAGGHDIKRMTTDFAKLICGGREGYSSMMNVFSPGVKSFISFSSGS
jgi:predicted patatin/cPLA2 family phospholipase